MLSKKSLAVTTCLVGLGLMPTPSFAQELQDIVVTARKRDENLLQVPISISATTAQTLEQANIKDFAQLQYTTPGLIYNQSGQGIRADRASFAYIFRGLNLNNTGAGSSAATLFIDGAPNLFGRIPSLADAERVEVLKGPQTAYFGRSTFTGAINVVTKTPGNDFHARVIAEAASYSTSDVQVALEGPIAKDVLAIRASFQHLQQGGSYRDNTNGTRLGSTETTSAALTASFTPGSRLKVKLFGEYAFLNDGTPAQVTYGSPYFNCNPAGGATPNFICGRIPSGKVGASIVAAPAVFDSIFINKTRPFSQYSKPIKKSAGLGERLYTAQAVIDYSLPNDMTINSIVAYHRMKQQSFYEASHVAPANGQPFYPCTAAVGCERPFSQFAFLVEDQNRDFSGELRLTSNQTSRFRWTVGANYVRGKDNPGETSGELGNTIPRIQFFSHGVITRTRTLAAFGGAYFDITKQLTLNAEIRHQRDRVARINGDPARGPGVETTDPTKRAAATFKGTAPRVTLQYKPNPNLMLYTSWARGYRPGSFNIIVLSYPTIVQADLSALGVGLEVKQEKLDQYEIGIKGSAFDRRLQGSLTGYTGRIVNQQQAQSILVQRPEINFINTVSVISNVGRLKFHGVEAEASLRVSSALVFDGSFGWNWTSITRGVCSSCGQLGASLRTIPPGNRLANVPQFTGDLNGTYTVPITNEINGYVRSEYQFQSNRYATVLNLTKSGDTNLFNFRVGLKNKSSSLEGYVENAFNNRTVIGFGQETQYPAATPAIIAGLPRLRRFGVRATHRF